MNTIKLWINAFIPNNITGVTKNVKNGPHTGKTMIEGPVGFYDCFLTDNRDFSSDIHASSRMQSVLEIDLSDISSIELKQYHKCDSTIRIDCKTGEEVCNKSADNNKMKFYDLKKNGDIISVKLSGEARNPCLGLISDQLPISPEIDYEGRIEIDHQKGTVTFDGKIDEFPAFEMYVSIDDDYSPRQIFRKLPELGANPSDLYGYANIPLKGKINISPLYPFDPIYPYNITLAPILSGEYWISKFPGSKDIDDLESTFQENVKSFIKALRSANAIIEITSTFRPPERAYLMHWSWKIVKENYDAKQIPSMDGVNINWWHGDQESSKQAAQKMVDLYGINNLEIVPALNSMHIERKAIDMKISWEENLIIKEKDGTERTISTPPRNGANTDLIDIGRTYGVIHFINVERDIPHWSTNGR
jgi:hypothetical protein